MGKNLRYTNCGGLKENLSAFLLFFSADSLIYEREGMAVEWRNTAVLPPTGLTMPAEFFFLTGSAYARMWLLYFQ